MSNRHFHAWFIPGEAYLSTAARHYLGYMLSPDGPVATDTQIDIAGSGQPNTDDDWKDFVGGKGHAISKTLKLALMSYMVDTASGQLFSAYLVNVGEEETIGGYVCTKVWIETLVDLGALNSALYGKIVTYSDGSITTVAAVAAVQEPGTNMYQVWVVGATDTVLSGPVRIGIARILPGEEIWFESYFSAILTAHGGVGLLLLKFGERSLSTDDVAVSYCTQWYRCRLQRIALKTKYGNAPYLTYDMPVECAIYDPTTEDSETTVSYTKPSAPANVSAGKNSYAAGILVTWDAVEGASRYQVYVNTAPTAPTVAAASTLTDGLFQAPAVTNGLLAEMVAYEWTDLIDGTNTTFAPCGLFHGATAGGVVRANVEGLPVSGTADYPGSGAAIAEGQHFWYWVRARVGNSGTDEWTDLSEAAHGVTKITTNA